MFISSSGTPIRNGQKVKWFSDFILFPSAVAVIKIEAHTKRTKPEYQGSTLADLHAKAVATELRRIVAHAHDVNSTSAKNKTKQKNKTKPLLPDVCHLDALATLRKSDSESNNLMLVNNSHILNEELGLWDIQDNCFQFLWGFFWHFFTGHSVLKTKTNKNYLSF